MGQNMTQAPTVQRAIMNRHNQVRRSNSSIAPKMEPGAPIQSLQSPQSRPTPSSHTSSPTAISPGFQNPGVMTPPASDTQAQFQHQQHHQQHQQQHQQHQQHQRLHAAKLQSPHGLGTNQSGLVNTGVIGGPVISKAQGNNTLGTTVGVPTATALYPSPFQNHFEQLGKLSQPLFSLYSALWNCVS